MEKCSFELFFRRGHRRLANRFISARSAIGGNGGDPSKNLISAE
jgi:hypothetical protein